MINSLVCWITPTFVRMPSQRGRTTTMYQRGCAAGWPSPLAGVCMTGHVDMVQLLLLVGARTDASRFTSRFRNNYSRQIANYTAAFLLLLARLLLLLSVCIKHRFGKTTVIVLTTHRCPPHRCPNALRMTRCRLASIQGLLQCNHFRIAGTVLVSY
jgi:hypothetical protein